MAEAQTATAEAQRAIAQAYETVFGTDDGRLVLQDLTREAGVMDVALVPGDPLATAWNDGRRALALYVMRKLDFTASDLAAMVRERRLAEVMELARAMGVDPDEALLAEAL